VEAKEWMTRRFLTRSIVKGEISLPAVPSLLEDYVSLCADTFATVGRRFSDDEIAHLRTVLDAQLRNAYSASQRSNIVIAYNAPVGSTLHYEVTTQWWTVEGAYENWLSTREPPLFGTEPDARVWALACEAAEPANFPVLDVGAGTGRNALALARRGHPVDVVEMTPKFASMISSDAERDGLDVRVINRDVFTTKDDLRQDYRLMLLSEVVSDFRSTQQLRGVFEVAAHCLAPGGCVVFNMFLPRAGYTPDDAVREFGQQTYTSIFTRDEMSAAASGLPLELISDDSVYDYEKEHLPPAAWPPTSWYEGWVSGQDVFTVERERCPIEMRWLVYKKTVNY
jgi:2-polyprenyl-3-methyl-5-hydroxy-6-metoxy-1,4-benzoquinol methylase